MKHYTRAHKWLVSFGAIVLAIVIALSSIAYIIDPYFQFRTRDHSYMLSGWFVSGGLIKNYDYDTLIIGSSMTQNFDMEYFRQTMDAKPLHIGLGGINPVEIGELMEVAYKTDKATDYYIGIDLSMFTDTTQTSRNFQYLLNDDLLSRLRYLLSYEVWFCYIPVDLALMTLDKLGISLPKKFSYSRSIDHLENWSLDFSFGEDIVWSNYTNAQYSVSQIDTNNLYNKMVTCIDLFFSRLDLTKGKHHFFFPPYSSLFWCDAQNSGYFDAYLKAKEYFIQKAEISGATVYDFQSAEFTSNLNNYKDTTHYCPEINDWMIECFANQDYIVTQQDYITVKNTLINNTNTFRKTYSLP